jgi:transcription-repair coupling factor (superfamily II helicase)
VDRSIAAVAAIPAVQSLLQGVEAGGVLSFAGVATAAQPFLAALLHGRFPQRTILVVTDGLKAQEVFQQDVETWLGQAREVQSSQPKVPATEPAGAVNRLRTCFFPDWELLPHEDKLPHADVISDRLETLIQLARSRADSALRAPRSAFIVSNVTALMQRTFAPDALRARTRSLRRGDRVDPLDLIEWLEEQAYEPEAQVSQKGEIALRGGIVDVFPLTSPWPVRLEFFGDELESLRWFDPLTQMSREEVEQVTLPPAGELGLLRRARSGERGTRNDGNAEGLATLVGHLPKDAIRRPLRRA